MRDWLKNLLGGDPAPPEGVPEEWVEQLREVLGESHVINDLELKGAQLDSAVKFVLRGSGAWTHPNAAAMQRQQSFGYNNSDTPDRASFYEAFPALPGDVLLRWAQVTESLAGIRNYTMFYIPFPGNVHWPEVVMAVGSGRRLNVYPPSDQQRVRYRDVERMLEAAGMNPNALLVGAFATPIDSGYAAEKRLRAVSNCPDFAEAVERHVESLRPHLLAGSAGQKAYILEMLTRASHQAHEALAPELAELCVSTAKQVRLAADPFVQSPGPAMVAQLRKLATGGKPDQRQMALRHLHAHAVREKDDSLREFARATATADKAASVQALLGEWETAARNAEAPAAKYDYVIPVVDWSGGLRPELSQRLGRLWEEMNRLIREQNRHMREHYEQYTATHGKPQWKLRQDPELPAEWLEELRARIASGQPPALDGQRRVDRLWTVLTAINKFAGEKDLQFRELCHVLNFLAVLFGHDGRLHGTGANAINQLYAETGRPSLLELAEAASAMGAKPAGILATYCSGHTSIGRNWKREDVWPFIAHHVPLIERYLLGQEQTDYWFERSALYESIGLLPVPPPRIVDALYAVALGQGKSERPYAQKALENLPDKEARIIAALSDGKSEVRMVAAQWLGRLKHLPAIPALSKAVATEKHDTAKGAMLDALQALGEPVEKYLKRDSLLAEARKTLAKPLPKDIDWIPWESLPEVRWADTGEAISPDILKWMIAQAQRAKSPEPNAVLRKYCAMFEPRDRERFGQWVLDVWLREDVVPIPAEEAQSRAQSIAQSMFNGMKSHPQYYTEDPKKDWTLEQLVAFYLPPLLRQPRGSATGSKGILAVAAACAGERAGAPVQRYIKEYYGTRASQGKALIAMLAWIEHPSATQVMLAIGNRFRTKSIQEEATRQAEALAERKGWTLAELADRTIPSAGFDEDGVLELSYGTRAFVAKLLPDFKIELFNPEGKKVAALPEPRQEDDAELAAESKKALSAAKKEIKAVVALQTDRLYEALCTGREWPYSDWRDYLNRHPVVRHLVQRLIWIGQSGTQPAQLFRPLDDGSLTNAADESVVMPADAHVRLAHDSLMTPEQVAIWQQHLLDYEIRPLFEQIGKGSYTLPASLQDAKEIKDFEGHMLEAFALRGRVGKLGYTRAQAEDGGWFHAYEKRFPTLGITAVMGFTGSPLPEENRQVALLALTFESNAASQSWQRGQIPLKQIPKVLLSECYNDMRLAAAEGTGFDPDWEKKSAY